MRQFRFPKTFKIKNVIYHKVKNEKHRDHLEKNRKIVFKQVSESDVAKSPTFGYINLHLYYTQIKVVIDPQIIEDFDTLLLGSLIKESVY